jgi:hypothetical protein
VQQRVGGLLTPDNPMRNAARETLGLTQYKAGDPNAALESFQTILDDPQASQELLARVQVYVAQLISEGAVSTAASATDAAGAATPSVSEAPAMDVTPPAEQATPATEAAPATDAAPATEAAPAAKAPAAAPAEGQATGN